MNHSKERTIQKSKLFKRMNRSKERIIQKSELFKIANIQKSESFLESRDTAVIQQTDSNVIFLERV